MIEARHADEAADGECVGAALGFGIDGCNECAAGIADFTRVERKVEEAGGGDGQIGAGGVVVG